MNLTYATRAAAAAARTRWALVALMLLAACGQKGPLMVPGHSKDTPWPMRTGSAANAPTPEAKSTGEAGKPPAGANPEGAGAHSDGSGAKPPAAGGQAPAASPAVDP